MLSKRPGMVPILPYSPEIPRVKQYERTNQEKLLVAELKTVQRRLNTKTGKTEEGDDDDGGGGGGNDEHSNYNNDDVVYNSKFDRVETLAETLEAEAPETEQEVVQIDDHNVVVVKAGPRPGITSHGDEGLIETIPWTAEIEDEEEAVDEEMERRYGGANQRTTRERTVTSSSTSSTSKVRSEGKEMTQRKMMSTSSSTTSQAARQDSPPRIRMSRFQSLHNYRPFDDTGDDADDDKTTTSTPSSSNHQLLHAPYDASSPTPSRLSPYHHLHNQMSPNSRYSPTSSLSPGGISANNFKVESLITESSSKVSSRSSGGMKVSSVTSASSVRTSGRVGGGGGGGGGHHDGGEFEKPLTILAPNEPPTVNSQWLRGGRRGGSGSYNQSSRSNATFQQSSSSSSRMMSNEVAASSSSSSSIGGLLMPAERSANELADSSESIETFGDDPFGDNNVWNDNRIFQGGSGGSRTETSSSAAAAASMTSSSSSRMTTTSTQQRPYQQSSQQQHRQTIQQQQMQQRKTEAQLRPSSDQFNADDFDFEADNGGADNDLDESFCSTGSQGAGVTRVIGDKPHLLIGDTEMLGIPRFEHTFTFRVNENQDAFEAAGEAKRPLPPLKRGHPKRKTPKAEVGVVVEKPTQRSFRILNVGGGGDQCDEAYQEGGYQAARFDGRVALMRTGSFTEERRGRWRHDVTYDVTQRSLSVPPKLRRSRERTPGSTTITIARFQVSAPETPPPTPKEPTPPPPKEPTPPPPKEPTPPPPPPKEPEMIVTLVPVGLKGLAGLRSVRGSTAPPPPRIVTVTEVQETTTMTSTTTKSGAAGAAAVVSSGATTTTTTNRMVGAGAAGGAIGGQEPFVRSSSAAPMLGAASKSLPASPAIARSNKMVAASSTTTSYLQQSVQQQQHQQMVQQQQMQQQMQQQQQQQQMIQQQQQAQQAQPVTHEQKKKVRQAKRR